MGNVAAKGLVLAVWGLLLLQTGRGSGGPGEAGARSASLGGVSVVLEGVWSVTGNPAAIPGRKGIAAGVGIRNYYLAGDLNSGTAVIAWNTKAGGLGLAVTADGSRHYREITAGLGYGKNFGKRFAAGIRIDYFRWQAGREYGNRNAASFSAGVTFRAGNQTILGLMVRNPVPVRLRGTPSFFLPWEVSAGIGIKPAANLLLCAEISRKKNTPLSFRAGMEYQAGKPIALRIGLSGMPLQMSFGAGLKWGRILIDIAASYHIPLGLSPSLAMTYGE